MRPTVSFDPSLLYAFGQFGALLCSLASHKHFPWLVCQLTKPEKDVPLALRFFLLLLLGPFLVGILGFLQFGMIK